MGVGRDDEVDCIEVLLEEVELIVEIREVGEEDVDIKVVDVGGGSCDVVLSSICGFF